MTFSKTYEPHWSDLDPNVHMRNSAYYDYAAQTRLYFLYDCGLDLKKMNELGFFPILFREEALFYKEIGFNKKFKVEIEMLKATSDYRKYSIICNFYLEDGTKATALTIEGAWMDGKTRKLTAPAELLKDAFDKMPKAANFELIEAKSTTT